MAGLWLRPFLCVFAAWPWVFLPPGVLPCPARPRPDPCWRPLPRSYAFAASSGAFVLGALGANALNPMTVCECALALARQRGALAHMQSRAGC